MAPMAGLGNDFVQHFPYVLPGFSTLLEKERQTAASILTPPTKTRAQKLAFRLQAFPWDGEELDER